MHKQFSSCEIVEIAIQIEKNGKEFYAELAKKADKKDLKKAFEGLVVAESDHIKTFEGIFNATCSYEPREVYPEDYFAYMNALAKQYIFTQKDKNRKLGQNVNTFEEAIQIGIQFEKDSILLYAELKRIVPEEEINRIDKLIEEEKKHLIILCDLIGGCAE